MPSARATEALIRRTLSAWTAATGRDPGGVEVTPDGTVRVLASAADSAAASRPVQSDEEARCAAAFGVGT